MDRRKLLVIPLVVALVVGYFVLKPQQAPQPVLAVEQPKTQVVEKKPVESPLDVQTILELVNAERAKVGVKPLVMDERLNQSAKYKTDEIVITGNYSHMGIDGKLTAYKIPEYMPECRWYSENLTNKVFSSSDVAPAVQGLMGSKSHREAILDPRYEYTGIAITDGYVAEHFCDIDK